MYTKSLTTTESERNKRPSVKVMNAKSEGDDVEHVKEAWIAGVQVHDITYKQKVREERQDEDEDAGINCYFCLLLFPRLQLTPVSLASP